MLYIEFQFWNILQFFDIGVYFFKSDMVSDYFSFLFRGLYKANDYSTQGKTELQEG